MVAIAGRARELAGGEGVAWILGTGATRVGKRRCPRPRSRAVTAHNPFAVNDLWPDPTEPAG